MFSKYDPPKNLIPSDPRFAAGPSLLPVSFLDRLRETGNKLMGTSHRKPAIKNLCKEIQEGLTQYFKLPDGYEVVMGNGGATFFFDMCQLGLVEKSAAHFTCGEFSKKWYKSSKIIPWLEDQEISVDFGQGVTPAPIQNTDMICCTLNETSTGVIVDTLDKLNGYEGLVSVDATSGGGQVPCDLSKTDVYFFSPQKVFASDGGLYVAIMSPKAIERGLRIAEDKTRYIPGIMDFKAAIDNSRKNQTYTTPAVATLFFLNEQIKEMNKIGYDKVIELSQKKAAHLYGWANEKDYLKPFVTEERYRSNAVATIDVDDKYPIDTLVKRLRELDIVYDIDAYRKLGRNQFRIAMFHNILHEDLEKLTAMLSDAIEKA